MEMQEHNQRVIAELSSNEITQLRQVLHHMADLVAMTEAAHDGLTQRERSFEDKLVRSEKLIDQQIQKIQYTLSDIKSMTDEMTKPLNIARTRTLLNEQVDKGEECLNAIRNASEELVDNTKKNYERLENMTKFTISGISKAVKSFQLDDFKSLTEESCRQVKQTCTTSISRLGDVIKWFHWRNLSMVFGLTLIVSMIIGLYLNDEAPWEIHKEVLQQRNLAQAVLNVWPSLSKQDQSLILQRAEHGIIG